MINSIDIPNEIRDKIKAEFPDKTADQTRNPETYNAIQDGHRNCAEFGYGLALPEIESLKRRIAAYKKVLKFANVHEVLLEHPELISGVPPTQADIQWVENLMKTKYQSEIATLEKTIEDQDKLRIQDGLEIERLKAEVQKLTNELDNIKHPF
jgi:hypothetical protein